jgi:predicted N-acetyltransferase YhbS
MRSLPSHIKELAFVAIKDDNIVGNITYTKSFVKTESGTFFDTITFGPICAAPAYQGQGIGSSLIKHSVEVAKNLGYKAIIIYGDPAYYERFGFRNGKRFGICDPDGKYMKGLQVLELYKGALDGVTGSFFHDPVYEMEESEAAEFDKTFPYKERVSETESQRKFAEMIVQEYNSEDEL